MNYLPPVKLLFILAMSMTSLFVPMSVYAEAGRVVFSYGHVTAEGSNGNLRTLRKRSQVEAGDVIRTSNNSMVQIRMIDKGFIALRSNSEVKIEAYKLGAKKEEDVGIFALLKGGFRAVTGIIGKRLRSAYKMRTVNATIGIRGTDYSARLCNKDCDSAFGNLREGNTIADGLYVGVNQGGVDITNQLGTLDLDELQFGYVKDATTAPVALQSAPEFLYFNSRPPNPDEDQASSDDSDSGTEITISSRAGIEPEKPDLINDDSIKDELDFDSVEERSEDDDDNELPVTAETAGGNSFNLNNGNIESSRMIVSSYGKSGAVGSIASAYSNPYSAVEIDDNDLESFENNYIDGGAGNYSPGSTSTIDLGYDPTTGIAWGRWYNGVVQFTDADGNVVNLNMSNSSMHWLASPDQVSNIALPQSGSASYTLVGNTSPTDNLGNAGILGAATLDANFTNMTVDTSVDIGINNQVWNASGSGLPISGNGSFAGNMDSVQVNTGSSVINGTGTAAGFFTNNADGAGIGYALEADVGGTPTTVNGNAVFQK